MKKHSVTARPTARQRRKIRIRKLISGTAARPRLCVFRSSKHIRLQLISDIDNSTIAQASTIEADVTAKAKSVNVLEAKDAKGDAVGHETKAVSSKSVAAAFAVGQVLAERAKAKNVAAVVFDRGGFLYHGRIRAAAEGARAGGLKF